MIVTFVSQCEHKALNRTRRVLDAFANRIGGRTWQCAELPSKSIEWQQQIKSYAIKLKNLLPQIHELFTSPSFRPAITYSRMSLMLADHFYSSQNKDLNWHSSVKLFANTDHQNNLKQQLDEHLVKAPGNK